MGKREVSSLMVTYRVVFEARFENGLLSLVYVRLSVDELREELCKEDVHVDTCHVIDASGHLLPQEGVAVCHQNVQQNSQKMDDQVLREDRFLIQPPSRVYLLKG